MSDGSDGLRTDDTNGEYHSIKGIGWDSNLEFILEMKTNRGGKFSQNAINPYLVQVITQEDGSYKTPLIIDNQLQNVTLGFSFNGRLYHPDDNYQILETNDPMKDAVYLPLTKSPCFISLQDLNFGNPLDGSPFPVLGLDMTSDYAPIYMIKVEDDDILASGLALLKNGELHRFMDNPVYENGSSNIPLVDYSEFIDSLLKNEIVVPSFHFGENLEANLETKLREMNGGCPDPEDELEVDWKKPKTVVSYLDQYVVGQDDAKKKLAVAFKKFMTRYETKDEDIEKGNTLLIGPTGTGKTYMVSLLAKKAGLPFLESKVTGKSYTGIKGENMMDVFNPLAEKILDDECKTNAPYAVIFLDEFDKLASDKGGGGGVNMQSKLQQELIGWVEEANINMSYEKSDVLLNTKNILFVGAGAFSGQEGRSESLVHLVRERLQGDAPKMGFRPVEVEKKFDDLEDDDLVRRLHQSEDLEKFGLIPELVGRFSERATLDSLTQENLATIFSDVKGSTLDSYRKIIENDGFKLEVDDYVPYAVAARCDDKTGARAIKGITARLFDDIIYSPEDFADENNVIRITSELVEQQVPITEEQIKKQADLSNKLTESALSSVKKSKEKGTA
jgi:ATP-dependent Clp protease ATP-binding subunit ClpX